LRKEKTVPKINLASSSALREDWPALDTALLGLWISDGLPLIDVGRVSQRRL
jgi:hypothetical protein